MDNSIFARPVLGFLFPHLFHNNRIVIFILNRRVLGLLLARQYVDKGVFYKRPKDEHQAGGHPDVNRLDVGDAGQTLADGRRLRCHGEHGQQPEGDPGGNRVDVDPE